MIASLAPITQLTQITQSRLIHLRWLSVTAMVIAALASPGILGSRDYLSPLLALATVVAGANACLLLGTLLQQGSGDDPPTPAIPLYVQLFLDLLSWASFVYLSGGATNPLISMLLPLVAIGAIVLSRRDAWLLGLAAILAYSFLWRYYRPLVLQDAQVASQLHLLGMWLVFTVSTVVCIWFIQQISRALRERDAALAQAREQALQDDWLLSLGAQAASAAHELGTPLATLSLLVGGWKEDPAFPAVLRPDLALMGQQLALCRSTLDHLSQRARSADSQDDGSLPPEPCGPWLRSLGHRWQSTHPAGNLNIHTPAEVANLPMGPSLMLERALTNLLDNALAAGARQIELSVRRENTGLRVEVVDDGPGITPRALADFVAGRPHPSPQGMGLGLAIAKAALARQGIPLQLARAPGGGTLAHLDICLGPPPSSVPSPVSTPIPSLNKHEPSHTPPADR